MDILEILEVAANYILCDVVSYGYKVRICTDDTNGTSETNTSSESSATKNEIVDQFNFGQAMQHIYSNEKAIQNEIINDEENKPINSSIYSGVSYWYISDKVRLIVVSNGFRDNECSCTYYFDKDGNLTFALMKDDVREHRLYFCNDILMFFECIDMFSFRVNARETLINSSYSI